MLLVGVDLPSWGRILGAEWDGMALVMVGGGMGGIGVVGV
jgi:hypothetical protein